MVKLSGQHIDFSRSLDFVKQSEHNDVDIILLLCFQEEKLRAKETLADLAKFPAAHSGWIGDALRHLAIGGLASEAYKSFVYYTAQFSKSFQGYPDDHIFVTKFIASEKMKDKSIPSGDTHLDKHHLIFLIKRCEFYAEQLSATLLHSGVQAHRAQTYKRGLRIVGEIVGFPEDSLPPSAFRLSVASFAMACINGLQWGEDIDYNHTNLPLEMLECSKGLLAFALESMQLPMAKRFLWSGGYKMNPEYSARAAQLLLLSCSGCWKSSDDIRKYSFEKNYLLATVGKGDFASGI